MKNKANQTLSDLELNQQLSIMKIEMSLDISINPGDKVVLIEDEDTRAVIMDKLYNPTDKSIMPSVGDIKRFVDARKHITHGVVEFVSIGVYFSGPEIKVGGSFLPLFLVKTINGKELRINLENLSKP